MCAHLGPILLVGDNLVCIEYLVEDFVQRFLTRKVLVVYFRVACGEDSAEVFHSIELVDSFGNKVSEA